MPSPRLQKVSAHLVTGKIEENKHHINEVNEAEVAGVVDIMEIADDIYADVTPQEEAAKKKMQEETANKCQDAPSISGFSLLFRSILVVNFEYLAVHEILSLAHNYSYTPLKIPLLL